MEIVDVAVAFGAVRALDGVSLQLPDRGFVGVIGPNGAGKTTLFNVISGFVKPAHGRVRLHGRRVTDWSPHRRARHGLGRTFQNVGLNKPATVDENLRTAQEVSALRLEVLAFARPRTEHSVRARRQERAAVVELLGLGNILDTPIVRLPTGTAKLVELGCVLLRRPSVLLLDEPSSGLGPDETARLGVVLREVHREHALAILMIEHDMSLAMGLSEYLYVLDFGVPLAEGTPAEVRDNPRVIEAYLGQPTTVG